MLNVYAWSYGSVGMAMLGSLIIWRILAKCIRQDIWKVMNAVGAVVALLIILRFTVIGRESSNEHCFMVMAEYSGEFYREMIMNIFLYFPLGLTLGELTGDMACFSIVAWDRKLAVCSRNRDCPGDRCVV